MKKYNRDEFSPLDGVLIKACDKLAAFIEASLSIKHGMLSERLEEGKEKAYREYRGKVVGGVNFGQLFDYFE